MASAGDVAVWRRESLADLGQAIATLRKIKKGLDRACDGVKSLARKISKDSDRHSKECERLLGEISDEDERYYEASDLKDALESIVDADEQADDAKLQIGDSLDTLIAHLEELKDAVKNVDA